MKVEEEAAMMHLQARKYLVYQKLEGTRNDPPLEALEGA